MKPLVSVIIPMYNSRLYIERCILSILKQTYDMLEIIIVDDGGTDGSDSLVKHLQKMYGNIKLLYQSNSGPGAARNKAIQNAEGKYILFVDADDYLSEDYVSDLVTKAEENKAELVIAGYTLVYADSEKKESVLPKNYEKNVSEEWAYRISACCSRLYLREFWIENQIQFYCEKNARAEDVPVVLYSNAMAKNICIVKNAGYFYYQHSDSAMNNKKKKVKFGFPYRAVEEVYKNLQDKSLENSRDFFYFGILKFFAQFDLIIYRKAEKKEKQKFQAFVRNLLQNDFVNMVSAWKRMKYKMDLPLVHKAAIELFILKYKILY